MEKEKYNITYILGAGASANALPTVRGTKDSLKYTDALREMSSKLELTSVNNEIDQFKNQIIKDLIWLADQGDKHGTPDTFAKFCQLKNDIESLEKVKKTISIYFTYEQFIENKKDIRYDRFITRLLDNKASFPDNIKILNWNYDIQIQLASSNFQREKYYPSIGEASLHQPPLINYYPKLGDIMKSNDIENNDYSLIHLNGIAGYYAEQKNDRVLNYNYNDEIDGLENLLNRIKYNEENKDLLLTFAFENYKPYALKNKVSFAKKIIENTDYLVVIGYSFPNDNIEIDKSILDSINPHKLKKIYFQDISSDGRFLKDDYGLADEIPIEPISYVDDFYIPRRAIMQK